MVRRCRPPAAGYTLVVLVIAITLLSIAVATALPLWSGQIQRDKEAELVFRGLQYAEAIRVFQRRFGRPPSTLAELLEVRPRSIRQLWKDPMTADGQWIVLVSGVQRPRNPNAPPGGDEQEQGEIDPAQQQPGVVPTGPVIGVRSKSAKESMRTFFGAEGYGNWRFTVDLLAVRAPGADGLPGIPRAAWLGKAFPPGVAPQGAPAVPTQVVPQEQPRRRRLGGEP
jgi:type II secretory pathway pseudopilin PulG